jgi:hypothetical protein
MKRKNIGENVPFPKDYEGINLNWLVLYAVSVIEEQGIDLSLNSHSNPPSRAISQNPCLCTSG